MGSEGTARPGFLIREFDAARDAAIAGQILREARGAASWSEQALRETALLPGVGAFVSEHDGAISGIVVGRQVLDEAEILNLAVRQELRRHGEGRALVHRILQRFAEQKVSRVFLEVRESNAAGTAFYEKHGFSKTGRRAGYYRNPEEAAIRMERRLAG